VLSLKVCQRALDILSDFNSFVDAVEAKKVKIPDTKSFDIVKTFCRDPISHLVSDIPALNALCRICSPHEPTSINLLLKSFSGG
jgi:hypothetical protein